ncbi:DEAD/DEAH box helicase, partial [Ostertagia ostertagi]
MRDDIFKRLTFGIKKTPRQIAAEHEDNDGHASLRLRVLPENIKEELRNLRKRQSGEQILVETKEDDQVEEGFKLFSDGGVPKSIKTSSKRLPVSSDDVPSNSAEIQKQIAEKIHQLRRSNRIYTWGEDISDPFIDFKDLNLPSVLMSSLDEFGIGEPTPIQMQAIPLMMKHRDILASAPTGSGKTLAFAIPVIMDVLKLKKLSKYKDGTKLLAVVLEPTRELASQTYRQFLKFGQGLPIKAALFENEEVPQNVDVLVSTPNRLAHHLQDMQLKFLRWLIVDESDRLFEVVEGQERCFRNQLASVYKACDGKFTRRAFFSATFSYEVEEWCKENLNNVAMVCIGERNSANANVTQELVFAGSEQGKLLAIRTLLQTQFEPPGAHFCARPSAKEVWRVSSVCVVPHITPPILWLLIKASGNSQSEGRTGRAGRRGRAITYFTESDTKYLRSIATVIHQAGFEVPEYTLSLKPLSRNEKKQLVRHAPKRKHIAFVKKKKKKAVQAENGSKQSDEPVDKKAKVEKAAVKSIADNKLHGDI